MTEPTTVVAGDTVAWTRESGYDPATHTLKYSFVRDGKQFSVSSTQSGTGHAVSIAASATKLWEPGSYAWTAYVETAGGAERYTIDRGTLQVLPDPTGAAYDPRSTARVMLDNIEAYLRDPNNLAAASYSIGGRSLSRWMRADLLAERARLQAEVKVEERKSKLAAGLAVPRLGVRF